MPAMIGIAMIPQHEHEQKGVHISASAEVCTAGFDEADMVDSVSCELGTLITSLQGTQTRPITTIAMMKEMMRRTGQM